MSLPAIENLLTTVGRRHARAALVTRSLLAVSAGAATAGLVRVFARLLWDEPHPALIACTFALAAAVAAVALYRPPLSRLEVARLIDARLELRDRLATAVEWGNRRGELAFWLLKDAEQQARLIDPRSVVPFPPRWSRREQWSAALLVLGVVLWFVPVPKGLLSSPAPAVALTEPVELAASAQDELLARIALLRERLRQAQTPELRRFEREVAALQAGLRDRSLRRDEAAALLNHLERRAGAALDSASEPPALPEGMGTVDLDRIQDIARRLVTTADRLSRSSPGARENALRVISELQRVGLDRFADPEALERALEQLMAGDEEGAAESLRRLSAGMEDEARRGDPQSSQSGAGFDSEDFDSPGDPVAAGEGASEGAQGPSDPGAAGAGAAEEGFEEGSPSSAGRSGSQPGEGRGGADEAPFDRPFTVRPFVILEGEQRAGPLRTGVLHTSLNLNPDAGVAEATPPAFTGGGGDPLAAAAEREAIPLEYREVVRRYFRALEPVP